ncbi:DUF2867 domain-containing protein [Streptomyces sp. ACA25]|uniref:DUF2867 domain-containing protein n=1 Tax=Streptomyces sp. ACA25 TaxID=3022596 RepID=UPI0023083196|nr:DUF2867 domain-containing protein [Streptomyces sp. ACA25]MDB1089982.1 DUF2867 domain-containing protein [Streptomyces sp. ACA25]
MAIRFRMEVLMRTFHTVHERVLDVPAGRPGALMDRLAAADDPLWPAPAWPALRFDRPLGARAEGGHGPIRYAVDAYEPGRRLRFRFTALWSGFHELVVEPMGPDRCRVRHRLEVRPKGRMRWAWIFVFRPLHNALFDELFDNMQRAATGSLPRPVRWSPWVRLLHRLLWERPRRVPMPAGARLAQEAFGRVDFADAFQVRLHPAMPQDPDAWRAVFSSPPRSIRALFALRQALVGLVGIRPDTRGDVFPVLARREGEILLGADSGHLDFRISLLSADRRLTLTTVTRLNNRRGRLYFAVVRRVHPFVIRTMLRRTHRELALGATPGARAAAAPGPAG